MKLTCTLLAALVWGTLPEVEAQSPGTKLWEFNAGHTVRSSPAIGPDGTIYFTTNDEDFCALNPDGTLRWAIDLSRGSPTIGTNGVIYLCSNDWLNALDLKPSILWRFRLDSDLSFDRVAALATDGTIFAIAQGRKNVREDEYGSVEYEKRAELYSVSPSGQRNWRIRSGNFFTFPPVLGPNRIIYFGNDTERIFAIDATGVTRWSVHLEDDALVSPAVGGDGSLYVAAKERLYAIDPNGTLRWEFRTGQPIYTSPAIGLDGTIYFGCDDHRFYALTTEGKVLWTFETTQEIRSSPAVSADGTVYFGGSDGIFYALDPKGAVRWKFQTAGAIESSPNIAADGTVYVGSNDRRLHAFKGTSPLAKTPWPRFRGGMMQTGRVFENDVDGELGSIRFGPLLRNAGGQWSLMITNQTGKAVQIEASSDLVTWVPVGNLTSAVTARIDDNSTNQYRQRFYRAKATE